MTTGLSKILTEWDKLKQYVTEFHKAIAFGSDDSGMIETAATATVIESMKAVLARTMAFKIQTP